jgi:hypothetical protein
MLGRLGTDRGDTGNIDERHRRMGLQNGVQESVHELLGSVTVQHSYEQHHDNSFPDTYDRSGKLQYFLMLPLQITQCRYSPLDQHSLLRHSTNYLLM